MFGLIWWLISIFFTVRLYQMAKIACRLLRLHVIYPKLGWSFDLDPYKDSWAVVTGGTDGIGKAYLNEVAAKGFKKFALVGRNRKKLDGIQRFLTTKHKAEVQILVFDFSSTDYKPLEDFIKSLGEIGALFNFVGTISPGVGKYCEAEAGSGARVFTTNALSAVKLTDLILPGMAKADKGLIVHCSSGAGYRPMHNGGSYSASKAAVSFLGETTAMEYNSKTLRIQTLIPLYVSTKMLNYASANNMVASPEEYAEGAVSILGQDSFAAGCLKHELQYLVLNIVPFWLFKYAINFIINKHDQEWNLSARKLD